MMDYFKGKRVLVTGASGFIGTNLVTELNRRGAQVIGTHHRRAIQKREIGVKYLRGDLKDENFCDKICKNIDYVFMAAANTSGAQVIQKEPLAHLSPNIIMNTNMLASAYKNNIKKFCFISSNTVYPVFNDKAKEDDCTNEFYHKYHIVAWMKRFSEIMCDMYSNRIEEKMDTLVVRPGNLYGPYDKFTKKESKVIAALIRRAIEKEDPFTVWGDGNDLKDFIYITDFIEGMLDAFQMEGSSEIVNIAYGKSITIKQVINAISREIKLKSEPVYDASKPTMIPIRKIDITKIQNKTNWKPKTSIEDGIRKTINWYRDYYGSETPEIRNKRTSRLSWVNKLKGWVR